MPERKDTMKRFVVLALVALSVVTVGLPASTRAAVTQFQFSGTSATGQWTSMDGCIERTLGLFATHEQVQQAGQPERSSLGMVSISEVDVCNVSDSPSVRGVATVAPGAFSIHPSLTSATLNTTVNVVDSSSPTPVPVEINVTWTATGESEFSRRNEQLSMPGWKFQSYNRDKTNHATVAGTVMVAGHNLAPDAGDGAMVSAKLNSIEITH